GVLRAIGLGSRSLFLIFLGKAALIGLLGAPAGYFAGILLPFTGAQHTELAARFSDFVEPVHLGMMVLGAPLLAVLASWFPALLASRQDPARILSEER
ncbi:MAG: FtsX-like permease family protein, partial [Lentisphaerae bacterium]|nr:FtsX-like permease family protein [Lentisphaerota bacterium]